jgi:hypothetical protein
MIKVGIVAMDTSHCVEFTKRFNHIEIPEEMWVQGCQIVAALPRVAAPGNEERQGKYIEQLRAWGVKIVENEKELMSNVDVVMVESVDGNMHVEHATPYIKKGMRVWIDKPFASTYKDAKKLAKLAAKFNAPMMSASSLRFALEVQKLHEDAANTGKVVMAWAYTPSKPLNEVAGLMNYGIHGVETLFGILHGGCQSVSCLASPSGEMAVGKWTEDRLGTVVGLNKGAGGFGFAASCEKKLVASPIDSRYIYRELLKQVAKFFETGVSPVPVEESVETIGFIEKALVSAKKAGKSVALKP